MSHKKITEMTQEEMQAYIEELRPHLEALARGEQYMMDALAEVAEEIISSPTSEIPAFKIKENPPVVVVINAPTDMVYLIDPNDLTESAVLDTSADGEEPADD